MTTRLTQYLQTRGTHEVGFMQTMFKHRETLPYGAVLDVDTDNFLPVYLDGYDADGNAKVKFVDSLTDAGMWILTTPELRPTQNVMPETLGDFYNLAGEMATVEKLIPYTTTFQTTAFVLDGGATDALTGYKAYFDHTQKKYVVCNPSALPVAYTNAGTKFDVRYGVADIEQLDGRDTVSLMCIAN